MMKSALLVVSLLVVLTGSATCVEFDRAAEHARRFSGLDLARRADAAESAALATSTTADGPDVQFSQVSSPARFGQDQSRLLSLPDGGWWVVWTDDRNGCTAVVRQRYDSTGAALADNEVLAGSTVGHDYADPRLARDTLGRVYFSWRDQTAGMLYLNRYDASGSLEWSAVLLNDTAGSNFAGPSDLAVFPDGQVVVAWEDYSQLGSTIQVKLLSSTGSTLAGPTLVNSDGGSVSHWVPAVAVAPGSGFVVCWEDYRNGQADIYARQFDGAGNAVGSDFALVAAPDNAAAQYAPAISYSIKDRYVIGWTDLRLGHEIFLQRFSQTTGLVGTGLQVSSGLGLVDNRDVGLSNSAAGRTQVVWSASGADNSIQSLMLDSGLVPAGMPARVNLADLGRRWAPAARFAAGGAYAVAWTESVDDDPDIALMLYTSSGVRRLGVELTSNDDAQGAHSSSPVIIAATDWWNVAAYVSGKVDRGDICVRTVSNAGGFLSDEIRINQDAGSGLQAEPSLAATSDRVLVVWNDARTLGGFSGQRIFARRMRIHGVPVADEMLVSDSAALGAKASPRIALRADGSGMVVWLDARAGQSQVYGHHLNASGLAVGDDFEISPVAQSHAITRLFAGCDASNRLSVIWFDAGAATPALHVQRYNSDGSDAGAFVYAPTSPTIIEDVAADIDAAGRVALVWTGYDDGDHNAYATILNASGVVQFGPSVATESPASDPTSPAVSVCNNSYVVAAWLDRRTGSSQVCFQVFDPSLVLQGANQTAAASTPEFMRHPAVDAHRGRAWFVWVDPRSDGFNVHGNRHVYLATGVDDEPIILPTEFSLAQNYPNPFNPATEIEYTLPRATDVRLIVFNVLGQQVRILVSGELPAGTHRTVWDGRGDDGLPSASGVYFYRLSAYGESETRKMMLLK